ncbi:hypothetical protein AOQ84DRAFT_212233 [Glonium stellatum]|uniref:Uncharacterized protein n=1 Tax=Glonium stellatum TaxID=574774 RepID=A0A8E2F5N6_9PEZI|nr:hypothetical protein AOQ84DRAFT_212233 [Glonium stellatum]
MTRKAIFSHQARPSFLFRQPARCCECQSSVLSPRPLQPFETPNPPHSTGRLHSKPSRPRCNAISSRGTVVGGGVQGPLQHSTTKLPIIFSGTNSPAPLALLPCFPTTYTHCALLRSRRHLQAVLPLLLPPQVASLSQVHVSRLVGGLCNLI